MCKDAFYVCVSLHLCTFFYVNGIWNGIWTIRFIDILNYVSKSLQYSFAGRKLRCWYPVSVFDILFGRWWTIGSNSEGIYLISRYRDYQAKVPTPSTLVENFLQCCPDAILQNYTSGTLLTGEIKQELIETLQDIIGNFQEVWPTNWLMLRQSHIIFIAIFDDWSPQRRATVTDEMVDHFMHPRPIKWERNDIDNTS